MEDLADVLKRKFCGIYKKKPETFTIETRIRKMNDHRKTMRNEEIFGIRRIPENMSPVTPTPAKKRERTPQKKNQPQNGVNKRFEMLLQWKQQKEKRKEAERKKTKPVFKVGHIPVTVGLPNLENVNKEIKGKPFTSKFAPPNHQFKPPANIKPIHFNNVDITKDEKNKKTVMGHHMTTRSRSRTADNVETKNDLRLTKPVTKKLSPKKASSKKNVEAPKKTSVSKNSPTKKSRVQRGGNGKSEISLKTPTATKLTLKTTPKQKNLFKTTVDKESSSKKTVSKKPEVENTTESSLESNTSSEDVKTPQKTEPPVYISPFVTISRGKNSARKEYEARKSRQSFTTKPDIQDCTSPKAGARYFTWLLDSQVSRLQDLCAKWNKYKDEESPPEGAIAMIDVAIGQTNLLITKKFEQFRGLIDKCNEGISDNPVTCEDLHGFWDMMHLQVDNLDKRFENLDNMRTNNWEEILPEVKNPVVKKKSKPIKNAKASAGLKAAIAAARKKKQGIEVEDKDEVLEKTPKNRRSSRVIVVKTEEKDHRKSSPGLMMMKIAQYAKTVETPAKSILKTDRKSVKSHSKSVLFIDELDLSTNVENDLNKTNTDPRGKRVSRRSLRFTKSKLF